MPAGMEKGFVKARRGLSILWLALAPLAVAQSPEVQLWKSATSGITYKLTVGARRLTAEKVFPIEFQPQVDQGAFVRCEYSEKDGAWAGKCRSKLPFAGPNNRAKWCGFKFTSKITLFTPARIEGESEVWNTEDVDVEKCELNETRMQRFVWIPKK